MVEASRFPRTMAEPLSPAPSRAERFGGWLFRHRSYTLLPLVVLVPVAALMASAWPIHSGLGQVLIAAVSVALLAIGEAIRVHVTGRSKPGTSGRGAELRASLLVTTGLYSHTRNPLYLGNLAIWAGMAVLTGNFFVLPVVLVVVGLQYYFIVRAEERFLIGRHGDAYREFLANVPRFLPRWRAWKPASSSLVFDWRRAIFREHDTIYAIFAGAWGLTSLGHPRLLWGYPLAGLAAWYGVFVAGTVVWLAVKRIKRAKCQLLEKSLAEAEARAQRTAA